MGMRAYNTRRQRGASLVEYTLIILGLGFAISAALGGFRDAVSFQYLVAARSLSESETLTAAREKMTEEGGGTWQGGEAPAWYLDWLRRMQDNRQTQGLPNTPP